MEQSELCSKYLKQSKTTSDSKRSWLTIELEIDAPDTASSDQIMDGLKLIFAHLPIYKMIAYKVTKHETRDT